MADLRQTTAIFLVGIAGFLMLWVSPPAQAQDAESQADQFIRKGLELQRTSQYDSALWYFEQAKNFYEERESWAGFVRAENSYLETLLDRDTEDLSAAYYYDRLTEHYNFAVSRLGSTHDRVAQCLGIMGMAAYAENKLNLAVTEFDKAIAIYEQNHGANHTPIVDLKTYKAIVLRRNGKFPESQQALIQAKTILEQLGQQTSYKYAKCIMELAIITEYLGDLQQAYDYHKTALKIASDTLGPMGKGMSTFYINASTTSGYLDNFDEAVDYLEKSIAIMEQYNPDDGNLGTSYLNLGVEYYFRGYLGLTEEYWNKALAFYLDKGEGMAQDQAMAYSNLSVIHNYRGDFEKSINFNENAMAILHKTVGKDHPDMIFKHFNLAETYLSTGNLEEAERHALRALEISQMVHQGDHIDVGSAHDVLASVYVQQKAYPQARAELQIALDMFDRLYPKRANQDTFGALAELAGLLRKQQDYEGAIKIHEEIHELGVELHGPHAPSVGVNLGNLAYCLLQLNQVDSALQYYQEALTLLNEDFEPQGLTDNPSLDQIYIEYGSLFLLNEKAKAFRRLYQDAGSEQYLNHSWDTYQIALRLMAKMRRNFSYENSKQALNQEFQTVFEGALEVAYAQYQKNPQSTLFERAFNLAEQSKAVSLLESFKDSQAKEFTGMPVDLVNLEREVAAEFTYAKQKVASLRYNQDADPAEFSKWQMRQLELSERMDSLKNYMEQRFPRYFQLKYDQTPISIDQVQNDLLKDDQAIVEYFLGDSALFIFTITPQEIDFHRSDRRADLSELINGLRQVIADKGQKSEFQKYAHELFNILIDPIGLDLEEKQLIIIPDGELQLVPFDLLIENTNQGKGWNDLPYLFSKHQTSYAYSTKILKQNQDLKTKFRGEFLAFAPNFNDTNTQAPVLAAADIVRGSLVELKGALQEILAIKRYLPGAVLQASEATESRFKSDAAKYGILHLATHAIVDDVNPMNSKLLFTASGDSIDDGDLHVWELYNMNLNAQMAVLSACNTGYGKLQRGEGVLSLGRAFSYAGCPSIVMSLWPAQDQSTAQIMDNFYRNLANGETKDYALKLAKQQYLQQTEDLFTHPFYWAGFVVQGDTQPLKGLNPTQLWTVFLISALFVLAWLADRKLFSKM